MISKASALDKTPANVLNTSFWPRTPSRSVALIQGGVSVDFSTYQSLKSVHLHILDIIHVSSN